MGRNLTYACILIVIMQRTRRHGYLGLFKIQMNKALAQWLSKKQPRIETIENSVFGAKFLAIKIGMKTLQGLRYKLRMMGIPLSCLSLLCGDNISVIHNTQILDYTLRKKRNSICYHSI